MRRAMRVEQFYNRIITMMERMEEVKRREACESIEVDTLVWAKVDGHPWWPALITSPLENGKYRVDFVAHASHAFVTPLKLVPYAEGCPHPPARKCTSKLLLRAIELADTLLADCSPQPATTLSLLPRVEDSSSLCQLKQSPLNILLPSIDQLLKKYQLQTVPAVTIKTVPTTPPSQRDNGSKNKKKRIDKGGNKGEKHDSTHYLLSRRINKLITMKAIDCRKRKHISKVLSNDVGSSKTPTLVLELLKWLHMSDANTIEGCYERWIEIEHQREEKDRNSNMSYETHI